MYLQKILSELNYIFSLPKLNDETINVISEDNLQLIYKKLLISTSIISMLGVFTLISIMYNIINKIVKNTYSFEDSYNVSDSDYDSDEEFETESDESYINEENKTPVVKRKQYIIDEPDRKRQKITKNDDSDLDDEINKKSEIRQRFDMLFSPPP